MNTNIQVRIWANYKDFAEATIKVPLRILPSNYGEIFSPDRYRNIPCADYHSFLYTQDAICINYHTLVPPTQKLRDQRIVISLAIRRGFQLQENPAEVLSAIRRDFINYINDKSIFFDVDNVNGIEEKIISQVEAWEDAIIAIQEDEQIFVNQNAAATGTAFVSYENSDIFDAYIQKPARPEYKGCRLVFIVPNENKSAFMDYGISELRVSPTYKPSYQVYLTAYSTTAPIATINSLNDIIDVRKEKRYYKPLELKGSLKDNWTQWKVCRSADGMGYDLGVVFDAESKTYKLDFNKLSNPFSKFKFAWGTLDMSTMTLIVVGEELAKTIDDSLLIPQVDQYKIQRVYSQGDTIYVSWMELFQYDVSFLRRFIHDKYEFEPTITIMYKNTRQAERQWWEGRKEDYKIIITDETGKYLKVECNMDTPVNQIKLEKKSGIKIRFFWGEGKEADVDNPIFFIKDNVQRKADVLGDEVEFFQEGMYYLELKGYKFEPNEIKVRKDMDGAVRYLQLTPTFGTKMKSYILPAIICVVLLICGLLGGYFLRVKCPNLPPQQEPIALDSTMLQEPIVQEYVKTQLELQQLRHESVVDGYKARIKSLEEEIGKNRGESERNLAAAMAKLQTLDYKAGDVAKAKALASNDANKLKICKACEIALNHCGGKDKKVAALRNFLNSDEAKPLPKMSKEALQQIVDDPKYSEAYGSINKSFDSINKLMDAIRREMGEQVK